MSHETILKLITMAEGVAIWAILALVIHIITKSSGMAKSLPKETKKRLSNFKKNNSAMLSKMTDSRADSRKSILKMFRDLKFSFFEVHKVFSVYSYDHPASIPSNKTMEGLHEIQNEIQEISACIAKEQYDSIKDNLQKIDSECNNISEQLTRIIALEEQQRILNS